jgi:hypothetical protein
MDEAAEEILFASAPAPVEEQMPEERPVIGRENAEER